MKLALLLAAVAIAMARADEKPADNTLRRKVTAQIVAAFPLARPAETATPKKSSNEPVLMMQPFVVESTHDRDVTRAVEHRQQKAAAEKFSPVKGGTLLETDRVKLGSWWNPTQGWHFLQFRF